MHLNAQIQAVIELIETIVCETQAPADSIMQSYFRNRRYIGSSDRRHIGNLTYGVLRQLNGLQACFSNEQSPRLWVLQYLLTNNLLSFADLDNPEENKFSFMPPTTPEVKTLKDAKPFQKNLLPKVLQQHMTNQELIDALHQQAPMDVRVNCLKANQDDVFKTLKKEEYDVLKTPYSPDGIRFASRLPLENHPMWKNGTLSVQDEGAQLASLLCDIHPKQKVLDACAGAGGKSLNFAAQMQNTGQLILSDVSAKRLERAKSRIRTAGISNYQIRVHEDEKPWYKRQKATFDRVILDVPCSGTGTWRRKPDLKFKFSAIMLKNLLKIQAEILETYKKFVKPGGYLIYITCSVLVDENEKQIENFLQANTGFTLKPAKEIWQKQIAKNTPLGVDTFANLRPHLHGCDGFFVAILEKQDEQDKTST